MSNYRLYFMDPVTGHIDRFEDFVASDDVEAIHQVSRRRRDVPVELWRDGEKVTRLDGEPSIWSRHQVGDLGSDEG